MVLTIGEITSALPVAPVFHKYVLAPFAVNVAVCPEHIVEEFTVTVGKGATETFAIALFVQFKLEPNTVYDVFAVGVTVIVFNKEPVLQTYVLAPLAVIVAVWPIQIVEEVTVTAGNGVTDTFAIAVLVQPNAAPITVYVVFVVGASVNVLNKEPVFQE